jgi:hypothetical protein
MDYISKRIVELNYMKVVLNFLLVVLTFCLFSNFSWGNAAINSEAEESVKNDKAHNEWLKKRFSKQHEQLIPVVAVADMFFSCNQARKTDKMAYELSFLINEMDRNVLAEKLSTCLGEDTMQSDVALNFGLNGCFHQQLAHLPQVDREQKMHFVKKAIASLSHEERKKSFTQCVTEQSIHYLK